MSIKLRSLTIFILLCFTINSISLNTAYSLPASTPDVQDNLAASSIFSDLSGSQHKDIANIRLALQAYLLKHGENSIDVIVLKDEILFEDTIYNPANMHFFFSGEGMKDISDKYASVKCRLKKADRTEDYYVIFAKDKDGEGFPLEVLTKKEWKKYERLSLGILPQRESQKPKDAKAISRHIQHEKGIDAVIKYATEHGLIAKQVIDKTE